MKKFILSVFTLVISMKLLAVTYTQKATVTLYDGVYYPSFSVAAVSDAEFAGGVLVNGYYSQVQDVVSMPLAAYAIYNGTKYESLVLDELLNMQVGIKTNSNTSYTFYFSGLKGTVKMLDKKSNTVFTLNGSTPYEFTIEANEKNKYINDRFVINYQRIPDIGDLELCFQYGILTITNNPYVEDIIIKDETGAVKMEVTAFNTPQDIDLSALAAGQQYTVEMHNGAEKYIIRK